MCVGGGGGGALISMCWSTNQAQVEATVQRLTLSWSMLHQGWCPSRALVTLWDVIIADTTYSQLGEYAGTRRVMIGGRRG